MMTHVERSQSAGLAVYIRDKMLGEFRISASPAQLAALGENGAQKLAEMLGKGGLRFEALDGEFEHGSGPRKGSLYVHVPGMGPQPLDVSFSATHTRQAEELLQYDGRSGTQASLLAHALNRNGNCITAFTSPERGAFRG